VQVGSTQRAGDRIHQRRSAFPRLAGRSGVHVGNPDAPGLRLQYKWIGNRTAATWLTHERDPLPVWRPSRHRIPRRRGGEVLNWFPLRSIDADVAVRLPVRNKGQHRSIRGPHRRFDLAAREEQLRRRCGTVDGRKPDAPVLDECDLFRPRCDHRRVAIAKQHRVAPGRCDRPHLHLRLYGTAGGIRLKVALGIPVRSVIAATHVHEIRAIIRERQVRELLPFVGVVPREPARPEVRTISRVNVPMPPLEHRPGDTRARRSGNEVCRERMAEHLLDRERALRECRRRAGQRQQDNRDRAH
jgi:hypothetical protein